MVRAIGLLAMAWLLAMPMSAWAQNSVGAEPRMTSSLRGRNEPHYAYQQGVDALFHHQYQNAVDAFRIYVRDNPDDPASNLALGVAFMGVEDYDAARVTLERVVSQPNPPVSARLNLGLAYLRLGQRAEAEEQRAALAQMLRRCRGNSCDDFMRDRITRSYDELSNALSREG